MRENKDVIRLAALLGCFASVETWAEAATLDITGNCSSYCINLGLSDGDVIGGTIDVDENFYSQDGESENEALESYSFTFGNFSLTSADKPDPTFRIGWGSTPGSVFNISLVAALSDDPAKPGPWLAVLAYADFLGNATASLDGYTREIPGCCIESGLGNAADFSLNPIGAAPIPLPTGGALILGAIASLGLLRRRTT
jgi:hypothetical protein